MQSIENGYRGLSLILRLNLDRLLTAGALLAALSLGAMIGSQL